MLQIAKIMLSMPQVDDLFVTLTIIEVYGTYEHVGLNTPIRFNVNFL